MTALGAAATTWQVDTARSTATFAVSNLGVRRVRGTVPVQAGTVVTDADGRVVGLRATVDATRVDTGNARRDRDLRSPRLLDVEQTPTWSFVSDGPVQGGPVQGGPVQGGEAWRVPGVLTVRRACEIVLSVGPPGPLPDGALRVRATTALDRRDAGVRAPRALVGRHVDVELDVVLRPAR